MRGLNQVFLIGNLTRDPEMRYTVEKRAWARFGIAVNYSYKNKSGEWQEGVDFINIVVWGQAAESCGKFLKRGSSVFVQGKLRTSSYEARDGSGKRYSTDVIADEIIFVGARQDAITSSDSSYGRDRDYGFRQQDTRDFRRRIADLDSRSIPGSRPLSDLLKSSGPKVDSDGAGTDFDKSIYEKDFSQDYNFDELEKGEHSDDDDAKPNDDSNTASGAGGSPLDPDVPF